MNANSDAGGADVSVLVVDDSSFNRLLLKRRLAELGYSRVTTAEDGIEGLAAIDAQAFDVVLLDIEMPGLDGIGVLERLHASGRREPPVIVISALTEMSAIVRCIELGAEDYLPKSFDPPLLRARLSAVIEKKRLRDLAAQRLGLLEAELESARSAQLSLVPRDFASIGGGRISLSAAMIPARQVGGDLYDAIRLDDRTLLFSVADVSGKGAPAGLTMARTLGFVRASARLLAGRGVVPDPADILTLANAELARDNDEMTFVTILVGVIDMQSGLGRMANAAHECPLLFGDGTSTRVIESAFRQPPLGTVEDLPYRSEAVALHPGSGILLFTDGVTEAEDAGQSFFGQERLLRAVDEAAGLDAEGAVQAVLGAVDRFAGGAAQTDDITLLALRFAPD